jgi:hypothetical protein
MGALHALNRDAAAMSIAEDKATGFRKQRRIGRLGHADAQEEDQGSCDGEVERMGPFALKTRVGSSCRIQLGENCRLASSACVIFSTSAVVTAR